MGLRFLCSSRQNAQEIKVYSRVQENLVSKPSPDAFLSCFNHRFSCAVFIFIELISLGHTTMISTPNGGEY